MEEEELLNHKIEPNHALSYSAPLYLYYTNTSSHVFDSTNKFSDFNFEPYQQTETPPDSTTTSFADELFDSGVLLPLKLPPRLQNFGKSSSGSTSPNKSSFARPNLSKRGDFDPFTVALQKIRKEENCERRRDMQPPRRSRSLSPLRNINWVRKREKDLEKLNSSRRIILQSDEGMAGSGDNSNMTIGKNNSRKRKQIVLRMMKRPNVNYKQGLFTCFGFGGMKNKDMLFK